MIAETSPVAGAPVRRAAHLIALTWLLLPLLLAGVFAFFFTAVRAEGSPTSVRVVPNAEPQQTTLAPGGQEIVGGGWGSSWRLTPKAHFLMAGRVVSTRSYVLDYLWPASSLDLGVAWGPMSDPAVDRWVTWSQSGRWYYFSFPAGAPYTLDDVRLHSTNVHTIPANDNLGAALRQIRPGDTILLEGLLVDYASGSGSGMVTGHTSLSRADTGAGACEILYVQRLVAGGVEYR